MKYPEKYQGMDRYEARKRIVADLDALGLLEKIEDHRLMVPRGDRSGAVVEPYLTDQWYVKIGPLAEPAIKAVEDGDIRFVPDNWKNTYFEWMRNIQDWCISVRSGGDTESRPGMMMQATSMSDVTRQKYARKHGLGDDVVLQPG